ncbi:MAG TPA: DUF763 domain-containing protein [Syntrophales bacterium]|nr:DUF763 domain-containing protein [Syntrophales bacterium]HPI58318.1 DUF763 domain-containing protein [Syntrophales bacterium]HPN26136.1 DUF763 domain-containing protein [Syntrophales bacterium]HQM30513.1 DUF763 domain-containing protein [Syntrophales bacterium]
MKTGIANLPLHDGRAPAWLFGRMKLLAREIARLILYDFGPEELLRRLSDPFWFQAFGCVLGFDWHSSGLTTTTCGALKEGLRGMEHEIGFFVAGGKGRVSRRTPDEILLHGEHIKADPQSLVYASRMSAKVDNAAVQDGYQLYHHAFFFDRDGRWAVIQQGLNDENRYARRYHWLGVDAVDFVCEPHQAVCCEKRSLTLNLVAREGGKNREISAGIAAEHPQRVIGEFEKIRTLKLPPRHDVSPDLVGPEYLHRILLKTYEAQPGNFESLLGLNGVGPKTLRALSLMAELIYGATRSFRDPARFSFAHGGKDGHPYPVDRENYDHSITFLEELINSASVGPFEKKRAFERLRAFHGDAS